MYTLCTYQSMSLNRNIYIYIMFPYWKSFPFIFQPQSCPKIMVYGVPADKKPMFYENQTPYPPVN